MTTNGSTHPMSPRSPSESGSVPARVPTGQTSARALLVPTPMGLLRAFKRRWFLATTLGLVVGGTAAVAVWCWMPVKYTASLVMRLSLHEPRVLDGASGQNMVEFSSYQRAQAALITGRRVLASVLKKDQIASLECLPRQPEAQLPWLQKHVTVDFKMGLEFMRVSVIGDHPEDLEVLLTAITDAYLKEVGLTTRAQRLARLSQLQEIQSAYEETLRKRRADLRQLTLAVGSADAQVLAVKQRYVVEALAIAEKELHNLQTELQKLELELEGKQAKLKTGGPDVSDVEVDKALDQAPTMVELLARRDVQQKNLAKAKQLVERPDSPALRRYHNALAAVDAEIKAEKDRLRPTTKDRLREQATVTARAAVELLHERVELMKKLEGTLTARIDRLAKQSRSTTVGQADIEAVQREIAHAEKIAERVAGEVESLKLEVNAPGRVELWENASTSQTTMEQQRLKAVGGSAMAGLFLVFGIVSWHEFRYRRLASVDEITDDLGVSLFGTLPFTTHSVVPWRKATPIERQQVLTESIDAARTSLLHCAQQRGARVVVITSALSGEGKTFLSHHLAASLARAGFRTLLVDGDMRRPFAHQIFSLALSPGLSELLREEAEVRHTLQQTKVPSLWLIAGGAWSQQATQALARTKLQSLLEEMREQFDYIVIDSAPVLPVVDTLLIAQQADGVILAVLREVSQLPYVQSALDRLASVGVCLLGAVMNGAEANAHGYRYGYGSPSDNLPIPARAAETPLI